MRYLFAIFCILLSLNIAFAQKKAAQPTKKVVVPVCDSPQEKAFFLYGKDSLDHYIKQHAHFRDVGDKITGKATVVFIVETDGNIKNAEILSSSGNKYFDDEAVRVVKTISGWQPAKNKGKLVRSSDMLSVVFNVR